jgi:hypothetical protein
MGSRIRLVVMAMVCCFATVIRAAERCDPGVVQQYRDCLRIAESLRPDKPAQARVFAVDGSEFTAGQAYWMKGQLRLVNQACTHRDQAAASRLLRQVQQLIKAHQALS